MGDRYLRKLLVVGACATLRHRRGHSDALRLWASGMLERKTVKYKFNQHLPPMMRRAARLHRRPAWRQLGEERDPLAAVSLRATTISPFASSA